MGADFYGTGGLPLTPNYPVQTTPLNPPALRQPSGMPVPNMNRGFTMGNGSVTSIPPKPAGPPLQQIGYTPQPSARPIGDVPRGTAMDFPTPDKFTKVGNSVNDATGIRGALKAPNTAAGISKVAGNTLSAASLPLAMQGMHNETIDWIQDPNTQTEHLIDLFHKNQAGPFQQEGQINDILHGELMNRGALRLKGYKEQTVSDPGLNPMTWLRSKTTSVPDYEIAQGGYLPTGHGGSASTLPTDKQPSYAPKAPPPVKTQTPPPLPDKKEKQEDKPAPIYGGMEQLKSILGALAPMQPKPNYEARDDIRSMYNQSRGDLQQGFGAQRSQLEPVLASRLRVGAHGAAAPAALATALGLNDQIANSYKEQGMGLAGNAHAAMPSVNAAYQEAYKMPNAFQEHVNIPLQSALMNPMFPLQAKDVEAQIKEREGRAEYFSGRNDVANDRFNNVKGQFVKQLQEESTDPVTGKIDMNKFTLGMNALSKTGLFGGSAKQHTPLDMSMLTHMDKIKQMEPAQQRKLVSTLLDTGDPSNVAMAHIISGGMPPSALPTQPK